MPNLQPLPRLTRPMDGYEYFGWIMDVIRDDPRRLDMEYWNLSLSHVHPDMLEEELKRHRYPACGTIACVMGWFAVGIGRENNLPLGSYANLMVELFGHFPEGELSNLMYAGFDADPGTAEYALAGIKHIDDFRNRHATQLRAVILQPPVV